MAITFTKNETFNGTRVHVMPDPDNEGETISETLTGIRDIEVVTQTASKHDYELVSDQAMPANNQLLVFKKTATV